MRKSIVVACLVMTVASVANLTAAQEGASSRGQCSGGFEAFIFGIGESVGQDVGYQVWTGVAQENCFNLDRFIEGVASPPVPGGGLACFISGFFDGLNDVVAEVTDQCVDECLQNGDALGELLGASVCGGADAASPPLCSRIITGACLTTFDQHIATNCPELAGTELAEFAREQCFDVIP